MNVQDTNSISFQIGKKGISSGLVSDVKRELSKNKLVKIKFLKNVLGNSSRGELSDLFLSNLSGLSFEHKVVGNVLFIKRLKK
jgi:RNA-binding protein YhbY